MDKTIDWCAECCQEVEVDAILKEMPCPNCGKTMVPCASCCPVIETCAYECPLLKTSNKGD